MSSEPVHTGTAAPADRRPAAWPWLLLPLVALAFFLALRTAKDAPPRPKPQPETSVAPAPAASTVAPETANGAAPSEDAESH